MPRPDRVMSWTNVVAGGGGVTALAGVLLPWATRTTVVYGEDATAGMRAWSELPLVAAVVVVATVMIVGAAAVRLSRSPGPGWVSSVLFVATGGVVVLMVIAWTVTVLGRDGPAVVVEGFQRSRTVPSVGAGLALLGGLLSITAGVVALTNDQLERRPIGTPQI